MPGGARWTSRFPGVLRPGAPRAPVLSDAWTAGPILYYMWDVIKASEFSFFYISEELALNK
jgi:hypothetical protein